MIDNLLEIPHEDIMACTTYDSKAKKHICLVCGREFQEGEIFEADGRYYDASRAASLHVAKEHTSALHTLTSFDKKYTGLTENQRELLLMMYDGLSDKEIALKTGTAQATVRHQRFIFREKAKQAKLYLAIYELAEKAASEKRVRKNEELLEIHKGATIVDDRYFITEAEEEKILADMFISLKPLKLRFFSAKEKKKVVILRRIASQFERGIRYSEKEVNAILAGIWEDYVTLRRYLIEYGFMQRTADCAEYWMN
jgi:hypothetical protein